jgi:hypothetical protein
LPKELPSLRGAPFFMARDNQKGIFYDWLYRHKSVLGVAQHHNHHKTHVNCSFNQNRFIITIITKITSSTLFPLNTPLNQYVSQTGQRNLNILSKQRAIQLNLILLPR